MSREMSRAVMKNLLLTSFLLGSFGCTCAQPGHDVLGWLGARVQVPLDSSHWAMEGSYQYLRDQRASGFYLHFGSLYLFYRLGKTSLTLSPGYVLGQVDDLGRAHLVQLRLLQALPLFKSNAQLRLTLDRLWFDASADKGARVPSYSRVRAQAAIEPMLSKTFQVMLNAEPFLYHSDGWFLEVRSQAGIRWLLSGHVSAQLSYFNRWCGYASARVIWEHAVMLHLAFQVGG
jgi:hypothetical protein